MADFETVKERIRDAVDIVDLVGHYVPLRRQGSNYTGRCPWHDDSRPSLQINPQRQTYKCWVCGIGGDIFSFIMKIENVDFLEALEILSEKTGIPLPQRGGKKQEPGMDGTQAPDKKQLLKAADDVAGLYHRALLSSEAEIARQYLTERKLDGEAVEQFCIGYAPLQPGFLSAKTGNQAAPLKVLEGIGNLKNGKDFFAGRLIFPIRNDRGNTVAFGGRLIPNSPLSQDNWHKDRKYLNTSETVLFSKHKILYGLDVAKQRIKDSRRAIIMEGYTDCITAHQFGFTDAVAVLGTALGQEHIKLLHRMGAEKIILMLDGDKAGQAKAESDNVLTDFITQGADMSVLLLPENLDPCEYLEKYGAEALENLLRTETADALEHIFRVKTRGVNLQSDIIASGKALDSILEILVNSPPPKSPDDPMLYRLDKALQNLAVRFDLPPDEVKRRFDVKRTQTRSRSRFVEPQQEEQEYGESEPSEILPDIFFSPPDPLETEMLELWLADPTAIYEFWDTVPPEQCRSPLTKTIYAKCNELIEHQKQASFANLMTAFDEPAIKNFLLELAESGEKKFFSPEYKQIPTERRNELIAGLLQAFEKREQEKKQVSERNRLKNVNLSDTEKTEQLLRIQQELLKKQKRNRE